MPTRRLRNFRPAAVLPVVLIGLALLGGCAHHLTPDASRPFEPIPEFSATGSLTLTNGQPSTAEVLYGNPPLNAHSWYANYNKWTDVAIEIVTRELKKRGMMIAGNAPKSIVMSVDYVHTDFGFVTISTTVRMSVKTSDGYSNIYTGLNSSAMAALPARQADGAMMRVVREMLMDPKIVAFLKGRAIPDSAPSDAPST